MDTRRCDCKDRGLTAHVGDCVIFTLPEAERVPFLFNQYMQELLANGCLTGDCPHNWQGQCDTSLANHVREIYDRVP